MTTPLTAPHWTIRRVSARVPATSPAPSARPVIACAAIAIASSTKARNVHSVIASWCVARSTSWSRAPTAASVTAYVVTSSAARRVSVRTTSGHAGAAGGPDAGQVGAQRGAVRGGPRGPRPTTNAAALAAWASTEPIAEPAMPRPTG